MNKIPFLTNQAARIVALALVGLAVQASAPSKLVTGAAALQSPYPSTEVKRSLAADEFRSPVPTTGTQKSPYQAERVYKVRCVPGSPVMVELPMGEEAGQIWNDKQWWKVESTPGSNRILITALAADGVRGRKSNVHVETYPSNLRVSFQVEAVGEDQEPPSVVTLYLDGNDLEAKARVQAYSKALHDAGLFKKTISEDMRANFEAWKAKAVTTMKDSYKFEKGKLGLERVVSDGNQTFISIKTTEQPALKLKNRDGVEETLNYEVKEGTFIVNHVLLDGEQFILVVGKETATIRPK